jgi:hypothetical protein
MPDITFDCPECSHPLIVDAEAVGLVVPCPDCATQIRVPLPEEAEPLRSSPATDESLPIPESTTPARLEYRVLSLPADAPTETPLSAETVAACLNTLSDEGWRLRSTATIPTRTTSGTRQQELLLILERPALPPR